MVEVQKRMRHPCFHYNAGSLPTFTIDSYEQSTKLCAFACVFRRCGLRTGSYQDGRRRSWKYLVVTVVR